MPTPCTHGTQSYTGHMPTCPHHAHTMPTPCPHHAHTVVGGGPLASEAGGVLGEDQGWQLVPHVVEALRENLTARVLQALAFTCRAEWLAREPEDVEVHSRHGSHVAHAAVLVHAHVLAVHLVDEMADGWVVLGDEDVLVWDAQKLQRQALCEQASAIRSHCHHVGWQGLKFRVVRDGDREPKAHYARRAWGIARSAWGFVRRAGAGCHAPALPSRSGSSRPSAQSSRARRCILGGIIRLPLHALRAARKGPATPRRSCGRPARRPRSGTARRRHVARRPTKRPTDPNAPYQKSSMMPSSMLVTTPLASCGINEPGRCELSPKASEGKLNASLHRISQGVALRKVAGHPRHPS